MVRRAGTDGGPAGGIPARLELRIFILGQDYGEAGKALDTMPEAEADGNGHGLWVPPVIHCFAETWGRRSDKHASVEPTATDALDGVRGQISAVEF